MENQRPNKWGIVVVVIIEVPPGSPWIEGSTDGRV